jgi:hypothetical protein
VRTGLTLSSVVVDGDGVRRSRQSGPDIRPLGFLALGFAVLSIVLAPTYFFSWLAYLPAVPALALGFVARKEEPIRGMGTLAVVLASLAIICATAVLGSSS